MLLDLDTRIQFISRPAPGLTLDEVLGTPIYDYISEDQHGPIRECYARVAATGEPSRFNCIYVSGEGSISQWESRVAAVHRDGEVTGFVVIAADVTERRAAALDRDRFFQLSLDLLCVADQSGYFTAINPSFTRVLGWTAQELLAEPLISFVHPDDHEQTEQVLEQLHGGKNVINFENRYRTRAGAYVTLQWQGTLDRHSGRIHAVARDVTEQRALQAKLMQSQKMDAIGRLAGGIAHDFNNLMLAVLGNAEFAAESTTDPEMLELLADITQAARRAADLTRQLLSLSRRRPLSVELVDINARAAELMRMLRRLIPENITVEFEPGAPVAAVRVDPGQLEQVMLNLCLNARDASTAGGVITLSTRSVAVDEAFRHQRPWAPLGHWVVLTVRDEGQGMSKDVRDRAFEPFFTTKAVGEGTGLGLATVYGIVEQHGGIVHVESTLGVGSEFEVYLPAATQTDAKPRDAATPARLGKGETILVVEDQELVRGVVARVLRRANYGVITAPTGEAAITLFRDRHCEIALVLLDVVMPGASGPEVYAAMSRIRPGLPVLFTSGYSDTSRMTSAVPKGATLLRKPYERERLLARVRTALGD